MPRFAILEHDFPALHWDLLLEDGPACRTWRLSAPPILQPTSIQIQSPLPFGGEEGQSEGVIHHRLEMQKNDCGVFLDAEALPDHRLMYLDYEGPVSGNRGNVVQWDRGTFVWITAQEDCVAVLLRGEKASGRLKLVRRQGDWRLEYRSVKMQQAGKPRPAV